jgi:glycine rich protein
MKSILTLRDCRFLAVAGGFADFEVDAIPRLTYDFETNSVLSWSGISATVAPTTSGMTFVPTGTDPMLYAPFGLTIDGETQRYIIIDVERTAVRTLGVWDGSIYYVTASHSETGLFMNQFPELTNVIGARVTYIIDMHDLLNGGDDWKNSTITRFRIDFEDGQVAGVTPNGTFKIHSISVGDSHFSPVEAGAEERVYNYTATAGDEWETGDGLYTISSTTLARTTILASSNNNQKVNFTDPPEVTMGQLLEVEFPPVEEMGILGKATYNTAQVGTVVTIPAGVHKAVVRLWGGTGGSGGSNVSVACGATGGAGFLEKLLTGLTPGNTFTLQVGAAGAAGSGTPTNGGNGTATILTSGTQTISTLTANGSNGSLLNSTVATVGGTATGGDTNTPGTDGFTQLIKDTSNNDLATVTFPGLTANNLSRGAKSGTGGAGNAGQVGGAIFEWYS